MNQKPLQVALHVRDPSVIEFTVGERVRLDRLARSFRGYVPERHGSLLQPGVSTRTLAEGRYDFKTLTDANLRVVHGGVEAQATPHTRTNDPDVTNDPDPPPAVPGAKGDELASELPALTIE